MTGTRASADAQRAAVEQPDVENYLPGTPRLSAEPGRLERFVTNLFRRRGEFRTVVRRARR